MQGKLTVAFHGEEGIDAGGVSREWYQVRVPLSTFLPVLCPATSCNIVSASVWC